MDWLDGWMNEHRAPVGGVMCALSRRLIQKEKEEKKGQGQ